MRLNQARYVKHAYLISQMLSDSPDYILYSRFIIIQGY